MLLIPGMTNAIIALGAVLVAWPMFRGDQGLTGVAAARLPEALELRWTFKTGQPIKSSAAIADHRVFIGSDDSNLYALPAATRSEEHTSELQSRQYLVCRVLLEKKNRNWVTVRVLVAKLQAPDVVGPAPHM